MSWEESRTPSVQSCKTSIFCRLCNSSLSQEDKDSSYHRLLTRKPTYFNACPWKKPWKQRTSRACVTFFLSHPNCKGSLTAARTFVTYSTHYVNFSRNIPVFLWLIHKYNLVWDPRQLHGMYWIVDTNLCGMTLFTYQRNSQRQTGK